MNDNNAEDELVKRTGVLSIATPAEHAAEIAHLKAMLEGSQAKNDRLEREAKKREKKIKDLKKEKREFLQFPQRESRLSSRLSGPGQRVGGYEGSGPRVESGAR
jgi:cell division protein FtsB